MQERPPSAPNCGKTTIPLKTTWVIGGRWPVRPFRGQIDDPRFPNQTVLYQVDFHYPPYQIEERQNLTIVSLDHVFLWDGDEDEFARWGRTTGQEEIALHIADIINRLIDLVQATFTATESNPFPHIRRVGPRDFFGTRQSLWPRTTKSHLICHARTRGKDGEARHRYGIRSQFFNLQGTTTRKSQDYPGSRATK